MDHLDPNSFTTCRPPYPYYKGLDLCIRNHKPPEPFGAGYSQQAWPRPPTYPMLLEQISQLDWCLKNPPTETPLPEHSITRSLQVLDIVAGNESRNVQVMRYSLDHAKDRIYIAKIFDALYQPYPDDVTYQADQYYSKEATAYEDIRKAQMDGVYTPKYLGSWTFTLPLNIPGQPTMQRPVRLVLIEELSGVSLHHILVKNLTYRIPPQDRLSILARAYEIESTLEFAGVLHWDLAPRNVMLIGLGSDITTYRRLPRVMLIDFNMAINLKRPHARLGVINSPRPINPLYRHGGCCVEEWRSWVPSPHRDRRDVWRGWVQSIWADSSEFSHDPAFPQTSWEKENERDPATFIPPDPDVPPPDNVMDGHFRNPL